MEKIIFGADLHFGIPGRLDDIIFACKVMREYAKRTKIDTVVILGDFFHDRTKIGLDTLNAVINFCTETKHEYKQNWITFPGNHDMFLKHSWDITSLAALRNYLTIIEDIKAMLINDQKFWVVPFMALEGPYMSVIRKINEQASENDILLTHIGVRGALYNTCFLLKDWSTVDFSGFKFKSVYTGHFHSHQRIHNVYYPGSLIPFKYDEGDIAHGFYVHNLEDSTNTFINIWKAAAKFFPNEKAPPQYRTIPIDDLNSLTQEEINNCNIRIALQNDLVNKERNNIKQKLLEFGARSIRFMHLKQEQTMLQKAETINTTDLFKSWVESDTNGTKDLDLEILYNLHKEVTVAGDEEYAKEQSETMID